MEQAAVHFVSTGIPGLDTVLDGGLRPGHLYFVEGESGTGKTTLALQFILEGVRRNERTLVVSFSETAAELRIAAHSHGWSLDAVEIRDLSQTGSAGGAPTLFHLAETALDDRIEELLAATERVRPQRLMLDTLSSLRSLTDQPGRLRQHLESLQRRLQEIDCTMLVVDELFGSDLLHPRSLAWGILRLEQQIPEYGPARRRLCVPKLRGQTYQGGYHDFRLRTGGLEIFPSLRLTDPPPPPDHALISTGLDPLDALLGGGLNRGTSTAVLGPPGSGKSTLISQLALTAANRGERIAVFLFDEAVETFRLRARGQGIELDAFADRLHLQRVDPAELSPGEFAHRLRQMVEEENVRFVGIDSLNGYLSAMPGERLLHAHVHELLTYLSLRGITTVLTLAQASLFGGGTQASVDLSYLADTVLVQRFFEAGGAIRSAIAVMKKRYGNHERTLREYQIGPNGILLGEPLSAFRGVLTGVPEYRGDADPLM
jgi:circadian clock protein KaiC